ncbi:TIM-barrel domain-containing protein [uncultured Faecalibaculum sp.]|uniref:glycoside hydrolase family 31 protein n=1 Tax=uncultured Faecalibaculum sp. TaxID=1729681 RepID=UPI0025DA22AB|nr:TIM-barrel domain-containing protein [uncultured Faecalibaculum sp.]
MTAEKLTIGTPLDTGAVVIGDVPDTEGFDRAQVSLDDSGFHFTLSLEPGALVLGLGEAVRGQNKRGHIYESWNSDDFSHTEDKRSLYGSHNMLLIDRPSPEIWFFDTPGRITFDVAATDPDRLFVDAASPNLTIYHLQAATPLEAVQEFRRLAAKSWLPPLFALGAAQSRWGYRTETEFREIASGYRQLDLPLDMICMDIDYMDGFRDFTLNQTEFGNLKQLSADLKQDGIRLIPIIDAGIKEDPDYGVYREGLEKGYFCTMENGEPFVGAVWPGFSVFPDFLNPEAAAWFGRQYQGLLDLGIEGFWNDMNEPALFFSRPGLDKLNRIWDQFQKDKSGFLSFESAVSGLKNDPEDYARFFHNTGQGRICHEDVHNLYGGKMTEAASRYFSQAREERTLLYSRASHIGAHRYGGIWTGDNCSWWSHISLLLAQLPALNMAGFLYVGCDLGGFGQNTTEDLVLRFMQASLFTPLFRNHSALGTRRQEPWQFKNLDAFRTLLKVRYRLIPYIYSELLKAREQDSVMFSPLAFVWDDEISRQCEDQLLFGQEVMIAPVTKQNSTGRMVWLPEAMTKVELTETDCHMTPMEAGWHWVDMPMDAGIFFLRQGKSIPLAAPANSTVTLDRDHLKLAGQGSYELWTDDGIHQNAAVSIRTMEATT